MPPYKFRNCKSFEIHQTIIERLRKLFFTSLYNNVNCRKSSERKLKESAKWHYIPSGLGDDHFRFKIVEFVPKIFRF